MRQLQHNIRMVLLQRRPQRTLLGQKEKDEAQESESTRVFRNKEKGLVTCSCPINLRWVFLGGFMNSMGELFVLSWIKNLYVWLQVLAFDAKWSLLHHCKKDNKVESKESKGATLNKLVELKSCSSCLFFKVNFGYIFIDTALVE